MDAQDERELRAVVVEQWPALLRIAYLLTAFVVAVAVLGVTGCTGTDVPEPSATSASGATGPSWDVTTWPTRGNLAGDQALLAEVRSVALKDGRDTLSAVPFVGKVDGSVVALLVITTRNEGRPARRRAVLVLGNYGDWQIDDINLDADPPGGPPVPVLTVAVQGGDERVRLVVVTAVTAPQGVSVAYSPRPEVDEQGGVSRAYAALPLVDGVGITSWEGHAEGAAVRVQRGGGSPVFGPPQLRGQVGELNEPPVRVKAVARGCARLPVTDLSDELDGVGWTVVDLLGRNRRAVAEVRALACRRVGGSDRVVLGIVLADGTSLRGVVEVLPDHEGKYHLRRPVLWPVSRGRAASEPSVILLRSRTGDQGRGAPALFFAPGGAAAALVRTTPDGAEQEVATVRLDPDGTGVAVLRGWPGGSRADGDRSEVVVRARDGHELDRGAVPRSDEMWDTARDGPVALS